jgi:Fic family protein
LLFSPPKLDAQELEVLEHIGVLRKELRFATSAPRRWSGLLRRNTLARAIRGSNSIEGYTATVEDVIAAVEGEEPTEAERETWLAVVGYRNAMTYVLQLARDPNFSYDAGYIRSLHFMMMQHDLSKNPGNWRPGSIFVRDERKNKVVYEAPDRELVEPLIKELVHSLNAKSDQPELVKAAMAHLNLVMIHPFSDGNGRMARCLQTLILAREGILAPEFCSIEEHLGTIQEEYYDILAQVGGGSWHPEADTRPWVRFTCRAHFTQASVLAWRMKFLSQLWEEIQQETDKRGLPERVVQPLVDAASGLRVRNASYRHFAGISENLASRDLKTLVKIGLLKPTGQNRGRLYAASPRLRSLREKLFEPFKPQDPFAR